MSWKVFDCAEVNPDCSTKVQNVEANPDIAGIGVVLSFLAATCLAFLVAFAVMFLDRYDTIVNIYRKYITNNKEPHVFVYTTYWRSPAFWSRVLSKNLLAFSDTQLLTGLAIQCTAMLQHCQMSVYHFQIVTELAFLTTVTHLLAVVALRNYFVKNRWINLPRIFFMLGNLGLLGYTSFVSYSYELANVDVSMSLACFFKGDRPAFSAAFGGKWAALLIGAIGGHVTVILAMYYFAEPEEEQKNKAWWWWLGASFRTWIVAPIYSIYGVYMAGSGLQYTQALGTPNVKLIGSEGEWSFGQFLPVLLLALPIFAGWESFWEEKDEDRDNRFGRHSRFVTGSQMGFEMVRPKHDSFSGRSRNVSAEELRVEGNGSSPPPTMQMKSTPRADVFPVGSPRNSGTSESPLTPPLAQVRSQGSVLLEASTLPASSTGLGIDTSSTQGHPRKPSDTLGRAI